MISSSTHRTAPPAAVAGSPTRRRCHSTRSLGLRVVPLWPALLPTDDAQRVGALAERLRLACEDAGREALLWELRQAIYGAVRNRARAPEERRALIAWTRYTLADAEPAWLAHAAAHGWSRPGA
ncbi:hypothetical protein M8C11_18810 [Micromonospora sp. CPM1]|uniref:hypothetical protein n=1 Tax=Micromonospora sp. CPM1 TaxID=2944809 RepID=UPI00207D3466|nr:hypothetical protein [Micromonospora sp. CPM1]MCO1616768.1 hypothetical protein [Micromonospora sp. CPM1]